MALNNSQNAIIDRRRLDVAQLRLRGLTQREIEEQLKAAKKVNPKSGKPWSLGTINGDLAALSEQWQKEATAEIAELKAQQLAEIRAARRQAWVDKDIAQIRQLIKLEMDLLGTEAPKRQELTGAAGGPVEFSIKDWQEQYQSRLDQAAETAAVFDNDLDT